MPCNQTGMGSVSSRARLDAMSRGEPLLLACTRGDLVAVAGDVAQAQHGAAAGGAALGLDVAAGERPHDDVEGRALA